MYRQIIFDAEVGLEFEEAVVWYDEQQPGLSDRFEAEGRAAFQRILQSPERCKPASKRICRARVEVFNK